MEQLSIGQVVEVSHDVTDELIRDFARLSGDSNPLHLDEAFAASTRFGRRIAHGMLPAAFISAVLGTRLPGPGTIYLRQSLEFVAPVFLGDRLTIRVEVIGVREDKPIVTLRTTAATANGDVVRGEAVVLVPRRSAG